MPSQTRPLPAALAARYPVLAIADIISDTAVARSAAGIRAALEAKDIQTLFDLVLQGANTLADIVLVIVLGGFLFQ